MPILFALLLNLPFAATDALVALPNGDVVAATRTQVIRTHPPPVLPHAAWTVEQPAVVSLARTPDARIVVLGTQQGDVLLLDARDGRQLGPCGRRLRGPAIVAADDADVVAVSTNGDLMRCRLDTRREAPLPLGVLPTRSPAVPRAIGGLPHPGPTAFRTFRQVTLGAGDRLALVGDGFHDGGALLGAVIEGWRGQPTVRLIEPRPHPQWPPLRAGASPHDPWQGLDAAAFAPDGQGLALGYRGGAVEVVDLQTPGPVAGGRLRWADGALHRPVRRLCWQGDHLLAAHWQGIRQMDARTGAWQAEANDPRLRAVACGAPLIYSDQTGLQTTRAWRRPASPARVAPAEPVHYRAAWDPQMKFVPRPGDVWLKPAVRSAKPLFLDAEHLLLFGADRLVKLSLDGRQIWSSPGTGATNYVAARLDADRVAIGDGRGAVAIYRLRDGKRLADLPGRLNGWVHALAVHPNGTELVAGTLTGDLGRWRLPDGAPLPLTPAPIASTPRPAPRAPLKMAAQPTFEAPTPIAYITDLQFAPDGGGLLMTGRGGALLFEDWPRLDVRRALPTGGFVYTARFSPDGRQIAIGEWGGRLLLLSRAGDVLGVHEGATNWVNAVRWRPDGAGLWAQRPRSLVWMDRQGATTVLRSGPVPAILYSMDLAPDGARLALVPDRGGVVITAASARPPALRAQPIAR